MHGWTMTIQQVRPEQYRTFFALPSFVRDAHDLGMTDRDEVAMMAELMNRVDGYPVVPDCGGMRKMRFGIPSRNVGKRGSCRVYYVHFKQHGVILLIAIFGKNHRADLTKVQKESLTKVSAKIEMILNNRKDTR